MTDDRRSTEYPSGGGPAFPKTMYYNEKPIEQCYGLSKREHYAVLLLAGMNANPEKATATHLMIQDAVLQADLLIEMLGKADRGDS